MKQAFRHLLSGLFISALSIPAAHAANSSVIQALQGRPELSQFTHALEATGVINEMSDFGQYTVFAPVNEAFSRLTPAEYPCLYSDQCRQDIAVILRNHIVPGPVYLDNSAYLKGGVYGINHRFISLGQPFHDRFAVDGHPVLMQTQLLGGMLYEIDGVIANAQELAPLRQPRIVAVMPATTESMTERTYYAPSGRPDGVSESTTVTRTTAYPPVAVPVPAP
ncbi:MAG: fasciclin domain-containing protein [Alphaproteobacteria bacterium]|nr:fasciclin domain-containing protein [Alphaproteobacteria bacterium]